MFIAVTSYGIILNEKIASFVTPLRHGVTMPTRIKHRAESGNEWRDARLGTSEVGCNRVPQGSVSGRILFLTAAPVAGILVDLGHPQGRALKSTLNFLGRFPCLSLIGIDLQIRFVPKYT
jgi:hypothetical protein